MTPVGQQEGIADSRSPEGRFGDLQQNEAYRQALNKAYRLLSYRARTIDEMRQRLQRSGYESTVIAAVLERCCEQRYLDDAQFCQHFIQSQLARKPAGPAWFRMALRKRGVAETIITTAVEEYFAALDVVSLAEQVAERSRNRLTGLPANKAYQRLTQSLLRRGFGWEIVKNVKYCTELAARIEEESQYSS